MENEFSTTIENARRLMEHNCFPECEAVFSAAMFEHPDAAVPHNLMGPLLEREGMHPGGDAPFPRGLCA